ncbi:MAG: TRAP transporter substrate-binding protein [Saprospiraceae bacterium]|nr:TRAP transporter substrate-binding protein [Saprospiraceae bacterium]
MINQLWTRLLFLALVCCILSCSEQEEGKVLKLAHGLDVKHPVHGGMVYMAQDLAQRSGGKLKIQIYPSGQLGSERQCLELLQIGSLDMTKVSAAPLENFSPKTKVLSLPYIFRDEDHAWEVFNGEIGKELLVGAEEFWLRGLCFYDAGSRSFYTKDRPINSPADLKGLKIRVQNSQTALQMVSALGGSPTPISFGELYTSLQQGVVDGAENNAPSFYTSRHYEVCKYYSIDEHAVVPDVLLIGTSTWNRLSQQEQEWLQAAADASVTEQRKLWKVANQEALDKVVEAGVEIIYPDKAPFSSQVSEIYESYKDNPEIFSLIERIRSIQ